MQGLILTKSCGIIPVCGWPEAPAVLARWGRIFVRTSFALDALLGSHGLENFFTYEERQSVLGRHVAGDAWPALAKARREQQ